MIHREPGTEHWGAAEERLWERERLYWERFCRGDAACYEMMADGFLGWPHNAATPQDRQAIDAILAQYAERPVRPLLELVALSIVDRVAVVHLVRRIIRPDAPAGAAASAPIRVVHAWLREADDWVLVGGMGCPLTPEGT